MLEEIKGRKESPLRVEPGDVQNIAFSKLQPVVTYTSTCENTYGDAIEQRQIRQEIAQLPMKMMSPKSLVNKKKKERMIEEIKTRVADQR